MIFPERVQEIHQAIVIHLTSDTYNFFQYNGKIKNKKRTPFSERLAKRLETEENTINFFIANQIAYFLEHQKVCTWIGNFCNKESVLIWQKYDGYRQNYDYFLKAEAKILLSSGQESKNLHHIYTLLLQNKVSVTTLSNFLFTFKLQKQWKTDDPLLEEIYSFLFRIGNFAAVDKGNFLETFQKARAEL